MNKNLIYKTTGIIGIFGSLAVVVTDVIGIAVHEAHNPISNTISMLAIGKYGWIQDVGLDLLGVGFFSIAIAFLNFKRLGLKWITGTILLILIAIDLILIAEHNQYAGRPGNKIHRQLVYALAVLFPFLCIVSGFELHRIKYGLRKFSFWIAGLWLLLSPLLPIVPDDFNGAYERLVGSLIVFWLATISYYVYQKSTDIS